MSKKLYVNILVFLIILAVLLLHLGKSIYNPYRYGEITDSDYLSNLRDSSLFGCHSFLDMKPEWLIVGDSHSYAAWNYNELSKILDNTSISSCTVGGFYLETFNMILKLMDENQYYPKKLIYGASVRQFSYSEFKHKQQEVHEAYIEQKYTLKEFLFGIITHLRTGKKKNILHTTHEEQISKYELHKSRIESITREEADLYIKSYPSGPYEKWRNKIKKHSFTKDLDNMIQDICKVVNEKDIELYVINIPISPRLERMYGEEIMKQYFDYINKFQACSSKIIIKTAEYYKIENSHYFNRSMDDQFPYEQIKANKEIIGETDQWDAYDLNHLNAIGAFLFTEKASSLILEKNENE